jgi:lipid-A-disaccharide synthase-like uncharacterized protein
MAMDMHSTLTLAYSVMGLAALVGYGPQMRTFWLKPEVCAATPLVTWSLWSCQTVVFFLYAVIANGDPLFMFNSGMFMLATLTCLGLIIRGRKQHVAGRMMKKTSNVVVLHAA